MIRFLVTLPNSILIHQKMDELMPEWPLFFSKDHIEIIFQEDQWLLQVNMKANNFLKNTL